MQAPQRRPRYQLHLIPFCTILPICAILAVLYGEPRFDEQLNSSLKQTRAPPLRVYRDADDEAILCVIPNVFQNGREMFVSNVYERFANEVRDCMAKRNFQFYSSPAPKAVRNVRRYDVDVLGQSFTAHWYHHFPHVALLFPQWVLVPASFLLPYHDAQLPTPTCLYPDDPVIRFCENGRYTLQPRILISKDVLGKPGDWVYEMLRLVTSGTMASMFKPRNLHVSPKSSKWEAFRTLVTSPQTYEITRNDRLLRSAGVSREPKCTRRVVIVTRDRRNKLDRTIPAATLQKLITELRRVNNLTIETVVDMGQLAFSQQVKLMQNTDVVLMVHGAEMSNILFLRSGASIIEIFPFGYWIPGMFRPMRKAIHLKYTGLSSPPDRRRFLNCMKRGVEKGKDNTTAIARGLRIFEGSEKRHRAATDEWGRWKAGAYLMSPTWARRCCRSQIIDFNPTDVAQLVLKHARSRCNSTVVGQQYSSSIIGTTY